MRNGKNQKKKRLCFTTYLLNYLSMKINITLSLDEGVVHYLKGQEGYSTLANRVLKDYIEGISDNDLPKLKQKLAEINQKQAKNRRQKKEITQKIKKIKEKESKILNLGRKYPDIVFKSIESCKTTMELYNLFRSGDDLKKFKWVDLKKLFIEMKGGGTP